MKNYDAKHQEWANSLFNIHHDGVNLSKKTSASETTNGGKTDKVSRYGWIIKDVEGSFKRIDKTLLYVDPTYQRTAEKNKIAAIASEWSWISCNTIEVTLREGKYFVIDGQHRALAAMNRSDIQKLPCMIFETVSVSQEAAGFISTNTARKAVSTVDIFKAKIIAEDPEALYIQSVLQQNKVTLSKSASRPRQMKSVSACFQHARDSRIHFERAISLASELCENCTIQERLFSGLYVLSKTMETPLTDPKLRGRICKIGANGLLNAATKASAYYERGGQVVWGKGMLDAINAGLRTKYTSQHLDNFELRGEMK